MADPPGAAGRLPPDLIKRRFTALDVDLRGDMTEIATDEGALYLATVRCG